MSARRPFEDRLQEWLDDGPPSAPHDLLEQILEEFPAAPQRRTFGRWPVAMSRFATFGGVAAAVLVVGVVLFAQLRDPSGGVPPSTTDPSPPMPSEQSVTQRPIPQADVLLVSPNRQIGFDYALPDLGGWTLTDGRGPETGRAPWVAFIPADAAADDPLSADRGVVVADVTDGSVSHGEAIELGNDPARFLEDLDSSNVFLVEDIVQTRLGGLPALSAHVTVEREWYTHVELPGRAIDLRDPSRVIVVQLGDALVLVQLWAPTERQLDNWIRTAMELVDSIHFVHVNGVPIEEVEQP